MDRITKSLLDEFKASQELLGQDDQDAFERFANFCTVSKEYQETFDVEEVSSGGGEDTGLDGIAVIVNGSLVTTKEEIEDLAATNGYVEATFILIQAKTSSSFDGAELLTFGFGARDFFAQEPALKRGTFVASRAELQNAVYDRAAQFRGKPRCILYYVTTGKWVEDPNLVARCQAIVSDLMELGLFKGVAIHPVDADRLHTLYQGTKNRMRAEIVFAERSVLPEIEGVKEAYLGVLPAQEYLKLITDDAGNILKSLFYDNVRDFQGENEVNSEIRDTLRAAPAERARFAILNNGVTVIAKSLETVGKKFLLEDYQIVNGCQTSHVLHSEHGNLEGVYVPMKVIVTNDDSIITSIIKGTNRQTEVKAEQLHALSDFQKKLERFFDTFPLKLKLYYERRSRQYASVPGIEKVRIVTMQQQIRSFASMFLDQPHRATRTYATLLRQIGTEIFASDHRLDPYYVSAFAQYKLEYLFRSQLVDVRYKPARYQLLMLVRHLVMGTDKPNLGSKKAEVYCKTLQDILADEGRAPRIFLMAAALVDEVSSGHLELDVVRTEGFTQSLLGMVQGLDRAKFHP
jgi:hypothetical protein